jgi:hypothetical protein
MTSAALAKKLPASCNYLREPTNPLAKTPERRVTVFPGCTALFPPKNQKLEIRGEKLEEMGAER